MRYTRITPTYVEESVHYDGHEPETYPAIKFNDFASARRHANNSIALSERHGFYRRITIWRPWSQGPDGRELLGIYETENTTT